MMVDGIELKSKGTFRDLKKIKNKILYEFRYRRRIIMKLDDHYPYQTVLSSQETEFNPNPSYIYIGGYHRLCSYDEQHCRSYRGCLKNVTIDDNYLNLINDEINRHRLLKQCHDLI
jgi:hypothetical protein